MRGWLRGKLGDAHQAADLAQDTFLRLLTVNSSTISDGSLREPRAYLRTIAGRLVVDRWRRLEIERAYLAVLESRPQDRIEILLEDEKYALNQGLGMVPPIITLSH